MGIEIRAAALEERPAICHMIDLAFDAESYGPSLANPCKSVGDSHMDPHDRPENTRILLVDGEIASVVHVAERQAYACGERAAYGFLAMVATHPAHRKRGFARMLMADAQEYMHAKGWAYAVLFGAFRTYGGKMGWVAPCANAATLPWKYVVPARLMVDSGLEMRMATDEDAQFLSSVYDARYRGSFGPVVRSDAYWRRWSLRRIWDGVYVVVSDGARPAGYFHVNSSNDSVDEIAWRAGSVRAQGMFAAAASWAGEKGSATVSFWSNTASGEGAEAFRKVFGQVERTFCGTDGQPAGISDPRRYLRENWADGIGHMVKFLNPAAGILADVRCTEDLAGVMARHSWVCLDGDSM